MVRFVWADPKFALSQLYKSCTIDNIDNPFYSFKDALHPLLAFLLACTFALYILAYPPRYKKLSILLLAIPTAYAFIHHTELAPNFTVCDTFGRFLYIWLAHMSLSVCIIEWSPPITKENPGTFKMRTRSAYKVLFCRSDHENVLNPEPKHGYSRTKFLLIHVWKATYLLVLQNAWSIFSHYYLVRNGILWGPQYAIFFRRLPDSLAGDEMWARFDHFIYWCVINMWLYESYHSIFAILFVGLGFDEPQEWGMSLFGPVAEARTVRGYWGKHWHNYIYASFSGHTKILTRQWLGMWRGSVLTRLVENTIVFGASGLMHSLVRYMQDPGSGGYMAITFWYLGQMVPIIIEGLVMDYWKAKKKEYGIKQTKWLTACEYTIGFLWVVGFNMWSITKYVHTRSAWAAKASSKKYAAQREASERRSTMETKDEL